MGSLSDVDRAMALAEGALAEMQALPHYKRKRILQQCADQFCERFDEFSFALAREAGKPINDARGEVRAPTPHLSVRRS